MKLQTASETIRFIMELEEKSADFYEFLSKRYPEHHDMFISFAKENRRYANQVQRAYYSVITDAIEGCFAFDLDSDQYDFESDIEKHASYRDHLRKVMRTEEKILDFYNVAAEQSLSLMADVPRNFKIISKKRNKRIPILKSMI